MKPLGPDIVARGGSSKAIELLYGSMPDRLWKLLIHPGPN